MEKEIIHPKGEPENALSTEELEAKICDLARYAEHDPEPWLEWIYGLIDAQQVKLSV